MLAWLGRQLRYLFWFALMLTILLVLAESALRAWGFSNYWTVSRSAEPDLGWIPLALTQSTQAWEGDAEIRTNALGFRGPGYAEKPPRTLRIAVLGDSFTEAVQVQEHRTWWARLDERLRGCVPPGYEAVQVQNFGVSGYSTVQALLTFDKYVKPFDADWVVLNFFPGNDLEENHPTLAKDRLRPFVRKRNERYLVDYTFRETSDWRRLQAEQGYPAVRRLRLVQLGDAAIDQWKLKRQAEANASITWLDAEPGVDLAHYREPRSRDWQEAWGISEWAVATLAERVAEAGMQFQLMIATTGYQTLPTEARQQFTQRHGLPDLDYPWRRLQVYAESQGIDSLALAPVLQFWVEQARTPLHGFPNSAPNIGHWNANGHRAVADALGARLCARFNPIPPLPSAPEVPTSPPEATPGIEPIDPVVPSPSVLSPAPAAVETSGAPVEVVPLEPIPDATRSRALDTAE